jgi:transcriptional regulator with GAF, ATPase, and Fis domain
VIQESDLPEAFRAAGASKERLTLVEAVDRLERQLIEEALEAEAGSLVGAARSLGTTERVVRYKVGKLGIVARRFRR